MANKKAKTAVQTAEEPAQEALVTKSFTVFQDVELSFTENLIPTHIPVKQYDNQARKVRCRLYQNSLEYKVSKDTIVSYSATRPDGAVFQYSSETRPDLVFVDDGAVILTVTSFTLFLLDERKNLEYSVYLLDETTWKDVMENGVTRAFNVIHSPCGLIPAHQTGKHQLRNKKRRKFWKKLLI